MDKNLNVKEKINIFIEYLVLNALNRYIFKKINFSIEHIHFLLPFIYFEGKRNRLTNVYSLKFEKKTLYFCSLRIRRKRI